MHSSWFLLPRSYISGTHFLYMCTAPAFPGPLLRLRGPFQQGYHPSYGTVCPPCREALTTVGAGNLKSLLHSSSHPLLPLKSCGPSLQHQCRDSAMLMILPALERQEDHTHGSGRENTCPFLRGKSFSTY